MFRRRKQLLLFVGIILLLSVILIYALICGVQSPLLLTVITVLLHISVCGSLLYFCRCNLVSEQAER